MHENINTHSEINNASSSAVEHNRPILTQPTEVLNFPMPHFNESINKSLEIRIVFNGDKLHVIKRGSNCIIDVKR